MTETEVRKVSVTTRLMAMAVMTGMPLIAGGCVNISAPDKPIQINLNINVTQEVVYRLDNEAKSLIKQNPGIF
ncbi:YnbE family lipoprotein [Sphingomonas ginsenosidimutans]|jgi:YnbE-like lipoprotein